MDAAIPTDTHCQSCGEMLSPGGVCAACAFGAVLAEPEGMGAVDSWLGEAETPQFALPGKLVLPARFGEYELRREIATGGMGVVYEAWHAKARRTVALKMVRAQSMASATELARFRVEAEAAAQLDHPHIVPIHEIDECEGQPFYTMKLIDGQSLAQRLKQDGKLPPREAAALMAGIARAVHHAHQRGVLHRDLKPGNILLDAAKAPYLTDFGLARITDAESGLTLSSAHLGTPHYMSPEQAAGRVREVSTASDVWSLGVILYQMLSGRVPFPGSHAAEVMRRILEEEPASLTNGGSSASLPDRDLATIVARCLERDAARRMSSALTLAEELELWLRGAPIRLRPVTGVERLLKWCRRHPGRVAAIAGIGLSLLAGGVASFVQWRRAEREASRALATADSERRSAYASTLAAALAARERHDFAQARRLLAGATEELRGFEWRLLQRFCRGDEQAISTFPGAGRPETCAWLPDGKTLAVITKEGRLHLRDGSGADVAPPRELPLDADAGKSIPLAWHGLTFAPDGRHFACSYGNVLRIFEAETLAIIFERKLKLPHCAWLDSGRLLFGWNGAISHAADEAVWIYGLSDRSTVRVSGAFTAPLAISADRQTVALSTRGQPWQVSLFHAADLGAEPAVPFMVHRPLHNESPSLMALSPSGKYLALSRGEVFAASRTVELVEVPGGKVWLEQGFREPITGIAFHPQQDMIALTSNDAAVRLWNFLLPAPPGLFSYDDGGPTAIRDPLDGNGPHTPPRRFLTRSAQEGRAVFLLGHEGRTVAPLFSADGENLFTASADGTLRRWATGTPEVAPRLGLAQVTHYSHYPAASRDGRRVLHMTRDGQLRMWREGRGNAIIPAPDHQPLAVLSADRFLTLSADCSEIILWQGNGKTITKVETLPGPGAIQGFSSLRRGVVPADETKVVGATPGQLFTLDLRTKQIAVTGDITHQLGATGVTDHAISPDGKWIAGTAFGHRTQIRPVENPGASRILLGKERDFDTAVAFHPRGHRLYTGNEDGKVRVWDTATWEEIPGLTWQAHRSAVTAIAVSHDGRIIATGGDDTLKLWRADSTAGDPQHELLSFPSYHAPAWIQFSGDGKGGDRALMHCAPWCPLEIWPVDAPAPAEPQE